MKAVDDTGMAVRGNGVAGALPALARTATLEITPRELQTNPELPALLPAGCEIYVPFLPRAEWADTLRACRRLRHCGMRPVPHLPARAVPDARTLDAWLAALPAAGVDALLLIAGDRRTPAGPYADTVAVLDSGRLAAHGIRRIGVAGHPEGHPDVSPAALERALAAKRRYARATGAEMWIVTQFVFSSPAVLGWLRDLGDEPLPVRIGLPGPATLATLLRYAAHCGVSASARALRRRPHAARLLKHWTPDGLLRDLACHLSRAPAPAFSGIHLFPFGGTAHCIEWLRTLTGDAREPAVPVQAPDATS